MKAKTKIPRPTKVRVFHVDYSITWSSKKKMGTTLGLFRQGAQKIEISTDQGEQQAADSLHHEIIHAIRDAVGCCYTESDEVQTRAVNVGLICARRDNPQVFAWIDQVFAGGAR